MFSVPIGNCALVAAATSDACRAAAIMVDGISRHPCWVAKVVKGQYLHFVHTTIVLPQAECASRSVLCPTVYTNVLAATAF